MHIKDHYLASTLADGMATGASRHCELGVPPKPASLDWRNGARFGAAPPRSDDEECVPGVTWVEKGYLKSPAQGVDQDPPTSLNLIDRHFSASREYLLPRHLSPSPTACPPNPSYLRTSTARISSTTTQGLSAQLAHRTQPRHSVTTAVTLGQGLIHPRPIYTSSGTLLIQQGVRGSSPVVLYIHGPGVRADVDEELGHGDVGDGENRGAGVEGKVLSLALATKKDDKRMRRVDGSTASRRVRISMMSQGPGRAGKDKAGPSVGGLDAQLDCHAIRDIHSRRNQRSKT
ncbi:hypothetical protein R3P38DRAFT_3253814 [Favolaschia claudopus]|uniref:Uncharacterized protein n=1 Tax=Favolaschia claudopus TaxID=2862362 RepID=A0AAW0DTW1_9AGAR